MTAITLTLSNAIAEFTAAGKTPWITIADDAVTGVYANRDGARAAKAGKPAKYEGQGFEVTNDTADTLPTGSDVADAMGFAQDKHDEVVVADAPSVTPVPPVAAAPVLKADKPAIDVRHASEVVRPTKLVWAIADEMKATNPQVTRKEILEECDRRGIAFYTARTQYQVWKSMQA